MVSKLGVFMNRRMMIAIAVLVLSSVGISGAASDKEKDQLKLAVDDLKAEITILERQVRSMQESMDRNSGQLSALIIQISDNVSAIRQAQGRVAESAAATVNEVNTFGERLGSTNQKMDRLSQTLAELKKLVQDMPKTPAFPEVNPGNPDMLFAAAYADYSRGNYALAISEFNTYVESYPSSEMADNAQYWIGECYFSKGDMARAIDEFDKVSTNFPKGDKVPGARYKKGKALQKLGRNDDAVIEFKALIKLFPKSNEAALAKQEPGALTSEGPEPAESGGRPVKAGSRRPSGKG